MKYYAFFDLDETIIKCKSMIEVFHFYYKNNSSDVFEYEEKISEISNYISSLTQVYDKDRAMINKCFYRKFKGINVKNMKRACKEWFISFGQYLINNDVYSEIKRHQLNNAEIAIISGSFNHCVEPIAQYLGINHYECAHLETSQGLYTGEMLNEPIIGEGKAFAIQKLIEGNKNIDLGECFAYGDHESDIPMLALTGNPYVVGDNSELIKHGYKNNWYFLNKCKGI